MVGGAQVEPKWSPVELKWTSNGAQMELKRGLGTNGAQWSSNGAQKEPTWSSNGAQAQMGPNGVQMEPGGVQHGAQVEPNGAPPKQEQAYMPKGCMDTQRKSVNM